MVSNRLLSFPICTMAFLASSTLAAPRRRSAISVHSRCMASISGREYGISENFINSSFMMLYARHGPPRGLHRPKLAKKRASKTGSRTAAAKREQTRRSRAHGHWIRSHPPAGRYSPPARGRFCRKPGSKNVPSGGSSTRSLSPKKARRPPRKIMLSRCFKKCRKPTAQPAKGRAIVLFPRFVYISLSFL